MPKSKRSTKVTLAQTDKKGRERKEKLIQGIRDAVDKFHYVYVLNLHNSRNTYLKNVRNDFAEDGRLYCGSNKVIAVAFGRNEEEEFHPGLAKVAESVIGNCAILITDRKPKVVQKYLQKVQVPEYIRGGGVATKDFFLSEGPLPTFSHAIEPHLRSLGMPTKLENGVVTLRKDFSVCKEGEVVNHEQAKILKLFEEKLSVSKLSLICSWCRDSTKFIKY